MKNVDWSKAEALMVGIVVGRKCTYTNENGRKLAAEVVEVDGTIFTVRTEWESRCEFMANRHGRFQAMCGHSEIEFN